MSAVEIEEAVSDLASQPFDPQELRARKERNAPEISGAH